MTFTNAVFWHGMLRTHGTQREMADMAVPCAHDTPRQATEFVNVIDIYLTKYSSDSVEIKCTDAEKCLGHTRIWRYLGFAGKFAVHYELARTKSYNPCLGFDLGFRTRVSVPPKELCASRYWVGQVGDSVASWRGINIGSATSFRPDHRPSIGINHRTRNS